MNYFYHFFRTIPGVLAWQLTQMSPGMNLCMNGNASPTTKAAHAVTQLNLFLGCAASALQ